MSRPPHQLLSVRSPGGEGLIHDCSQAKSEPVTVSRGKLGKGPGESSRLKRPKRANAGFSFQWDRDAADIKNSEEMTNANSGQLHIFEYTTLVSGGRATRNVRR